MSSFPFSPSLQPRTLCDLPSTLYPLPSTLYPLPSTLYPLPSTLYPLPSTLYPLPSTLYPLPCTLFGQNDTEGIYARIQNVSHSSNVQIISQRASVLIDVTEVFLHPPMQLICPTMSINAIRYLTLVKESRSIVCHCIQPDKLLTRTMEPGLRLIALPFHEVTYRELVLRRASVRESLLYF